MVTTCYCCHMFTTLRCAYKQMNLDARYITGLDKIRYISICVRPYIPQTVTGFNHSVESFYILGYPDLICVLDPSVLNVTEIMFVLIRPEQSQKNCLLVNYSWIRIMQKKPLASCDMLISKNIQRTKWFGPIYIINQIQNVSIFLFALVIKRKVRRRTYTDVG